MIIGAHHTNKVETAIVWRQGQILRGGDDTRLHVAAVESHVFVSSYVKRCLLRALSLRRSPRRFFRSLVETKLRPMLRPN